LAKVRVRGMRSPEATAALGPKNMMCRPPGARLTLPPAGISTPWGRAFIRIIPPSIEDWWISTRAAWAELADTSRSAVLPVFVISK